MDFLLKCNSLIEKISKHVLMTLALKNDQWHVKRKKAIEKSIYFNFPWTKGNTNILLETHARLESCLHLKFLI